jgi:hypothetical protein
MLVKSAWVCRSWRASLAPVVIVTMAWLAWRAGRTPDAQIVLIPAPLVPPPAVVVHVAPPPAAPPAHVDLAAPVIGRTCPSDVSAIGLPFHRDHKPISDSLDDGQVSRSGCTIAAWSKDTIHVSWDGGQSFATTPRNELEMIAVADGRIMAVRPDQAIGTLTAGVDWIWRASPFHDQPARPQPQLFAQGSYTVLLSQQAAGAYMETTPSEALIAFSSDNGERWSYLTAPVQGYAELVLDPDGQLVLTDTKMTFPPIDPDSGTAVPHVKVTQRATNLAQPAWRPFHPPGWTYAVVGDFGGDHFTTAHVTATLDGHPTTPLAGIRTNIEEPTLSGQFVLVYGVLSRFVGGRRTALPGEQPPYDNYRCRLIGEDGYGTAIVVNNGLWRWSDRGGWRTLL